MLWRIAQLQQNAQRGKIMRIGAIFPQTEFGADRVAVRDFAQTAEALGYDHILGFDHVIGAGLKTRPDWEGPYSENDTFHEVLVLFGFIVGCTEKIEVATGVIILPQRQTVLVAKQAAEIDVLSGGNRLRLGVGLGWNDVEFEALNEDFYNRGKRVEEQIEVLRALFKEQAITYKGKWHNISDAGINTLPYKRSIPIWMGAFSEVAIKRAAKYADGWYPIGSSLDGVGAAQVEMMNKALAAEGRDLSSMGTEGFVLMGDGNMALGSKQDHACKARNPDIWAAEVEGWEKLGATHISVNTMNAGCENERDHIKALETFMTAVRGASKAA